MEDTIFASPTQHVFLTEWRPDHNSHDSLLISKITSIAQNEFRNFEKTPHNKWGVPVVFQDFIIDNNTHVYNNATSIDAINKIILILQNSIADKPTFLKIPDYLNRGFIYIISQDCITFDKFREFMCFAGGITDLNIINNYYNHFVNEFNNDNSTYKIKYNGEVEYPLYGPHVGCRRPTGD